ncbi:MULTISPECIES: tryptophan--tRNA ligase [unclassified Pseudodesulfovibrio]|uniref:tryptophan--tRNA ligase n=1 Tax=unclassified Pseudodesulfovibrio TaxID=2661612 RepID=UPI000FEBF652|nr:MULTISPECIES: tryptophan--tRNA ligase [unclassified Pseudodesulfovibrio]MCJ2164849.1 tryptophan--tRNA ligase [Pseudodesulfovibrio sp. S3-i]RWU03783.1 tryptophan--tRNA ligase [Pseudodesulfovibrio sp. S3]
MDRILTGERTTGNLHIGHYFGSLESRIALQDEYETFIILADMQVLYDHLDDEKGKAIRTNVYQALLDNLAVGLNPEKVTFFVQSEIPELAELTMFFTFLVTVGRAKRNPTVKAEMEQAGTSYEHMNLGFLSFPVSQAADILLPKANLVPVGEDQIPHIEQTREVARRFNTLFGEVFPIPDYLVSRFPRLPGLDGKNKMSKSLNNVINLTDDEPTVNLKIKKAYSGEGHVLFTYGKLFGVEPDERMGIFKPALAEGVNAFLEPIRNRRKELEKEPGFLREILNKGRDRVREIGAETLDEVKTRMGMVY